jgi:hypothetical protein
VRVEIAAALLVRHCEALVIVELGDALLERLARRQGRQERVGDIVLGVDPVLDVGVVANVVFEPAVRIGDLHAEMIFDQLDLARLWIGWRRLRAHRLGACNV